MVSRRQFLSGKISRAPSPQRPPWHVGEREFTARCSRCRACLNACPTKLIVAGAGGFPEIDFARAACTFCGDCARSCPSGALAYAPETRPWTLAARIGDTCLAHRQVVCRSCGEACEARAIRFSPVPGGAAIPLVDTDTCTGCGACVGVCPQSAVRVDAPASHSASGVAR